jgi:hypothetical protein
MATPGGPTYLGGNASNLRVALHVGGIIVGPEPVLCRVITWNFRLDTVTAQGFLCEHGVRAYACDGPSATQRVQAKDPTPAAKVKALQQQKLQAKKLQAKKATKAKQRQQLKRQRDRRVGKPRRR